VFDGSSGQLTFERGISLTVPIVGVQEQRGTVRFTVPTGAGSSHYRGRWDGQKITGAIYSDPAYTMETGTFELGRR